MAQGAVFAEPGRSDARNELATLSIQTGNATSALALLSDPNVDSDSLDTARTSLALQAITASLTGGTSNVAKRQAQKAIFLTPGDTRNWRALACVGTR